MNSVQSNDLCLECGLCCNGVLFADGQLLPEDDVQRLKLLGLKLVSNRKSQIVNHKFHQPCAAFDGCRCNIYSERPAYCRQFECLLLKSVKSGQTPEAEALRIVRLAKKRVGKVKKLLRKLGDDNEASPLNVRFRKMKRRMEIQEADTETNRRFGELTLAIHDLNVLLSEAFYPGSE
jgi:Fe-S-cluster containining protein